MKHIEKGNIVTLIIILLVLLFSGYGTYSVLQNRKISEKNSEATRTLSSAEETPYTDIDGNPFTFEQFRGKVRVVNVWATWSPFSKQDLQNLQTIAEEFGDDTVAVIAINRKEPRERAKAYLKTIGDTSKVHYAIDMTDAYYKSVEGFAMPETIFYNKRGDIVLHKRGTVSIDELRTQIQSILQNSVN